MDTWVEHFVKSVAVGTKSANFKFAVMAAWVGHFVMFIAVIRKRLTQ